MINSRNPEASTNGSLTEEKPDGLRTPENSFGTMLYLPANEQRKGEGGLRTRNLFRKSSKETPLVTVITVVFNDEEHLENTIKSVLEQTYDNLEFIIIDGGSTDGTLDIIKRYDDQIDYWVSEPDVCLYDAMNKGIDAASGTWLNFMNSADMYVDSEILTQTMRLSSSGADVIYADHYRYTDLDGDLELVSCDARKLYLLHQSMIYKRALHGIHGKYLVRKDITISDYIFFNLIDKDSFKKSPHPISKNLEGGISYGLSHIREKYAVDYLFGNRGLPRVIFSVTVALTIWLFQRGTTLLPFGDDK